MAERRRDNATTAAGMGLVAGGGLAREAALRATYGDKKLPRVHALGVASQGTGRAKGLYGAGLAAGGVGAAAMAAGVTGRTRNRGRTNDGAVERGARGTVDAVRGKARDARQRGVPVGARAAQVGTALGAGLGGAALARRIIPGNLGSMAAPVVGTGAAIATAPLTNRVVQRRYPEYEVTATGVRRQAKKSPPPKRSIVDTRGGRGNGRADIVPSDPFRKRMSDEDYEMEAESLHIDIKNLYGSNTPAMKRANAKNLLAARDYYLEQGEDDLVEDAENALAEVMTPAWCRRNDIGLFGDPKGTGRYKRDALGRFSKFDPGQNDVTRRARVYAAGAIPIPVVNDVLAARQVYADSHPDTQRQNTRSYVRQGFGGQALGAAAGGAAAASALRPGSAGEARAMNAYSRVRSPIARAKQTVQSAIGKPKPLGPKPARLTGAASRLRMRPAVAAGAVLGGFAGAQIGQYTGMSTALRRDKRAQARRPVGKSAAQPTPREQKAQARRKATNSALGYVTGVAGLTSGGLMLAGKTGPATKLGIVNGGVAGGNGLLFARIQQKDAAKEKAQASKAFRSKLRAVPVRNIKERPKVIMADPQPPKLSKNDLLDQALGQGKANNMAKGVRLTKDVLVNAGSGVSRKKYATIRRGGNDAWGGIDLWAGRGSHAEGAGYTLQQNLKQTSRSGRGRLGILQTDDVKHGSVHRRGMQSLAKSDGPLEVRGSKSEHQRLLRQYGDRGPLPKELDRDTRARAYEARYVAHGGPKADRYSRRADVAEGVRNVGLAGATVGGAGYLAAGLRGRKGPLSPRMLKVKRRGDAAAVASATVGGAAELYGEYARGRRSSYSNTPGGVAASSLRRMRAYDPKEA